MSAPTFNPRHLLFLAAAVACVSTGHSQALNGPALVNGLRTGGYVIVMRHASSPRSPPAPGEANTDNVQQERQLDQEGRESARAMGEALRRLRIPVGQVLCSPTYRALETVRLAQLGEPKTVPELGDSGQSMKAESNGTRGAWLHARSAEAPPPGLNTVLVTHFPNITEAFASAAAGLSDGEALIFHPDGKGAAALIARVKIDEWAHLADSP
jgi:phosphohistidine phosphatase SixA